MQSLLRHDTLRIASQLQLSSSSISSIILISMTGIYSRPLVYIDHRSYHHQVAHRVEMTQEPKRRSMQSVMVFGYQYVGQSYRRIHTHCFVQASKHVSEFIGTNHVDLGLRVERRPNFIGQFFSAIMEIISNCSTDNRMWNDTDSTLGFFNSR